MIVDITSGRFTVAPRLPRDARRTLLAHLGLHERAGLLEEALVDDGTVT